MVLRRFRLAVRRGSSAPYRAGTRLSQATESLARSESAYHKTKRARQIEDAEQELKLLQLKERRQALKNRLRKARGQGHIERFFFGKPIKAPRRVRA